MGTTPGGYPYPEPTDPITAGAAAIKALAESTDALGVTVDALADAVDTNLPSRIASGSVTVNVAAPNPSTGSAAVTFTPAFSGMPFIVVSLRGVAAPLNFNVSSNNETASGFTIYVGRSAGSATSAMVNWVAVRP